VKDMFHLIKQFYTILTHDGLHALFYKIMIRMKSSYYLNLLAREQWDKAHKTGKNLVKILPQKIEYFQRLAVWYKEMGNDELATYSLERGLALFISPEKLIDMIESNYVSSLKSKYIYLGGAGNLGCIEHTQEENGKDTKYLTKISTHSGIENEKLFYLRIYKYFPKLRDITPKLINLIELRTENLILITMHKVEGSEPTVCKKLIKDAISTNNIITSIKYRELKDLIPKPNFDEEFTLINSEFPNHPISALHSFVSIYKKSTNQQLFHLIYKRIQEKKYSSDSVKLMKRLEKIIFDIELFHKINLDIHYTLQHGDFYKYNMITDRVSNKLYILDWGNMRIGPSWVDMAGFMGHLKIPFHTIYHEYLLDHDANCYLDSIEKICFVYTLIVTWFIIFTQSEFDQMLDIYLLPAVELVETMSLEISR
jgi:hypothetical protein